MIVWKRVKRKNWVIIGALVVLALIVIAYLFISNYRQRTSLQSSDAFRPEWAPEQGRSELNDQEKAILENVEILRFDITDTILNPQSITLKPNDQVQFFNLTTSTEFRVVGEGWGNILISPGENMTQPFVKPGKYPFTITELGYTGEVIVE